MTYILILTLIWVFLVGFSWPNLATGLIISLLVLFVASTSMNTSYIGFSRSQRGFRRVFTIISFIFFFLKELVVASVVVFRSVLSPFSFLQPGIIAIPLDLDTPAEITLLANLITLTPGTLTLDVSSDNKVIYVHTIRMDDPESFRLSIKDGFEKRIMEVMR